MVRAATEGQPGFTVDDREIRREGLSYSVDTMRTLRADFPDRSLCLIVGMDAFLGLPKWHQWRELLELAHLVVAMVSKTKRLIQILLGFRPKFDHDAV